MKKIDLFFVALLVAFSLTSLNGIAQQKKPSASRQIPVKLELPDLVNIIDVYGQMGQAAMGLDLYMPGNTTANGKTPNEITAELNSIISKGKPSDETDLMTTQYSYFVKYKSAISTFINQNLLFGNTPTIYYSGTNFFPYIFAAKDETQLIVLISGISYQKAFNELQTTPRKRASLVITSAIIPSLKNFTPLTSIPAIKHIGISIFYSSRNFLKKDDVLNNHPETITMVIPTSICKLFNDGKISEDELFKRSEFYFKDKDMDKGVKRIELTVE